MTDKIVNATFYLTPRQLKDLQPLFREIRRLKDGDDLASTCGQIHEDGRCYVRVLDVKQTATVRRAILRATAHERPKKARAARKTSGGNK